MRFFSVLLIGVLLAGCKASVATGLEGELEHGMRFFAEERHSSSAPNIAFGEYSGKFATTSAVNSGRSFDADYYGSLHVTLHENGKIECDWTVSGRMKHVVVGGVLQASSFVCVGRLQPDGSFGFRGAFMQKGGDATAAASGAENRPSFTLEGVASQGVIEGALILGGSFAERSSEHDAGVAFLLIPPEGQ